MEEELSFCLEHTEEQMKNAISHLEKEYLKLRTGKASPQMFDGVMVDYYGVPTPMGQVSNINIRDAKSIFIQPWEKTMLEPIEKAILHANLGFTPQNNGEVVIINVPPLTEERRREIVKKAKSEAETAKISIRNVRRDANEEIKKLVKDGLAEDLSKGGEEEVQKFTDKYVKKVDELLTKKEEEIMNI